MKKILFIIIITCGVIKTMGQSTSKNYIVTTIPTTSVTDPGSLTNVNSNSTIQYIDGLGRQVETVQKAITPSGKDLINIIEYDGIGREYRHWSPAPAAGSTGDYVNLADFTTNVTTQYGSAEQPYTTTEFEPSPLNRVTGQYGAGKAWYDATKKVKTEYGTNTSSTEVVYFFVNTNNQLERKNYYPVNSLYKTLTTDEDGKTITEYKDKLGHAVLKRISTDVDTYYVYNDMEQLAYVLPPNFVDGIGSNTLFSDDNTLLKQFTCLYRYDERRNCIYKRLPGCTPIYMVYDKANRMVLSQDGNERKQLQEALAQWTATKYDAFGRVVFMGLMYRNETDSLLNYKSIRDVLSNEVVTDSYAGFGSATPLLINYYDNYDFLSSSPSTLAYQIVSGYDKAYPVTATSASGLNATGLLTGTRTYHLNDPSKYEVTALYYDKYGRVVQTCATNHLGGYDMAYNSLDFMGKPTKTYKTHGINGAFDTYKELYCYSYDKAQRLKTTTHQLNNGSTVTIVSNTYDELGRLSTKNLGGVDATIYDYNVRNWTTGINGNRFAENLYYNANTANLPNFTPCYNGNIAGMQWSVPNESLGYNRAYTFTYDGLNHLTDASYCGFNGSVVAGTTGKYDEHMSYDKMGNFITLTRYENGSLLNNLSFTYTGNQLKKVNNGVSPYIPYGSEAFNDKQKIDTEYSYDQNGSTKWDVNTGISSIQYNLLNLSDQIQFTEGHKNMYTYDASGKKLEAVNYTVHNIVNIPINTISTLPTNPSDYTKLITDYVGNMIYENGSLKEILLPEGYYQGGVYYYYLKDHLGNNRVVINSSGSVIEKSHYYPSGMRFYPESSSNSAALPYRYSGKELEAMNGLNQYDYGARRRGAGLPIWTSVDPLCEKHYNNSPYVYCANNPVNLIDPDGMDWYKDKDGTNQYNPDLNKDNQKEVLGKGQSYVGETYQVKDDDGNVTTDYRKDGSIMYANETDGYNRMWSQANRPQNGSHGKEEFGIIKESGVLVLPDYKKDEDNNSGSASPSSYNYNFSGSKYADPVTGKRSSYSANIHTHQNKSISNPNLSIYQEAGDVYFAQNTTPNKPVLVMAWNGIIYGEIRNSANAADLQGTFANRNITLRSILHGTKLNKLLTHISIPSK